MGPEGKEGCGQDILDWEAELGGGPLGRRSAVLRDLDHLDQGLKTRSRRTIGGLVPDVGNRAIEAFGLPPDLVALAVLERPAQHGPDQQADAEGCDDVGMAGGVGQRGPAVDPNENRKPFLDRSHRAHALHLVVLARVGHLLPIEQKTQDLDGLGQASLPHRRRIEPSTDRGVLGERVPSPDAQFHAATAQVVDRRDLAGQVHRMVEVVVEHQGAYPEPLSGRGDREQRSERPPAVVHVVCGVENIEPSSLRLQRRRPQLPSRRDRGRNLKPEPKPPHQAILSTRNRSIAYRRWAS